MRRIVFPLVLLLLANQSLATASDINLNAPGPLGSLGGVFLPGEVQTSPVVLIVPGSGPTDHDGNSPMGITASSYKYLATELSERGIGTVRIDKRGLSSSAAAVENGNDVTMSNYADDLASWIGVIQHKTAVPCVWLLGHSEGGLVVLVTAQRPLPICGIILVATTGRKFGELLADQLKANPANAPLMADILKGIESLEAGGKVDVSKLHPALQQLFAPELQGFFIDVMSYNPLQLIANISVPVLIVRGSQDLQVSTEDAHLLKNALPDAELALFANANHVLKDVPTNDLAKNYASYSDPTLPLAKGMAAKMAEFVFSNPAK